MGTDDLEQADAVAFLLAHLRGDEPLVHELIGMHGLYPLFAATVGLMLRLLSDGGYGPEQVEQALVRWQAERRESL